MKNPLIRRIPRELKSDWHKYLVIVVFMVTMIGVISGMYVGHDSMLAAIYDGRETQNLEDGCFELANEASDELLADISTGKKAAERYSLNNEIDPVPVTVTDHFYRDEEEDCDGDGTVDATVRIYKSDSRIDKASFNEGRAPESESEIAIDRMHASNVGVSLPSAKAWEAAETRA